MSGDTPVQTRGGSFDEGLANGHKLLENHPAIALQQAQTLLRSGLEPRALQLAAAAWRRLGKPAEAEQAELSAIKASFAIQELDQAAVAGSEGRTNESRAAIERLLSRQPDNLLALTMAAELDIEDWQLERARQRLQTVIERVPNFLRAIMLLAKCFTNQCRVQDAIRVVEEVLERKPDNFTALQSLSQLRAEANDHADAATLYAKLIEIDSSRIDNWIMYAQILRMLGRSDESREAFRRAIALDPLSGAAWWGLTYYFSSSIADVDVEAMELALSERQDDSQDGAPLHIALGIVAERGDDFEGSFRHTAEGKRLRSAAHPYDSSETSANVSDTLAAFEPAFLRSSTLRGSSDPSPIFVVGMPRSGTTLLERILGRHSQIEAGGEIPIMPRLEEILRHDGTGDYPANIADIDARRLAELGNWYVDRSRDYRKSDKPRFIDKLNFNWSRVPLIRLMLPNARIIDLRRNALDCCWSNFKMMFAEGHNAANDQRDIARFYGDYVRMVEAVSAHSPGGILGVRYEDLVDDVEKETRRILKFLGLEYEPQCIDFHLSTAAVATPSSEQVRRPINRSSIGSAEPYRAWLGPMIEELGRLGL